MDPEWELIFVLPNLASTDVVENEWLAIVPHGDPRLKLISRASEAEKALLNRFSDQFGRTVRPSALLRRVGSPDSVDLHAIMSFRDLTAVSCVIDGRSYAISGGQGRYAYWSDYFDFYPYGATKDGVGLIAKTIASLSFDTPNEFKGQSSPHLPMHVDTKFDKLVLEFLLAEWKRHFINKTDQRSTRVLFRSIGIAAQAMRMPGIGTQQPTIYDVGASIGLWVSAFEVLTHPANRNANLGTVLGCLANTEFVSKELNKSIYRVKYGGRIRSVNFVQRVYRELYGARNDFMHGNRVTPKHLFPFKNNALSPFHECAPLVFRAALTGFAPPKTDTRGNLETLMAKHFDRLLKVRTYEDALERILTTHRTR